MRVTVKKWGNSAAVRLPPSVMQATHLKLDEAVEVRVDRGRILIERVTPKKYDLSALLKGIPARTSIERLISARLWAERLTGGVVS